MEICIERKSCKTPCPNCVFEFPSFNMRWIVLPPTPNNETTTDIFRKLLHVSTCRQFNNRSGIASVETDQLGIFFAPYKKGHGKPDGGNWVLLCDASTTESLCYSSKSFSRLLTGYHYRKNHTTETKEREENITSFRQYKKGTEMKLTIFGPWVCSWTRNEIIVNPDF
jgi:hypothetical protein